MPFIINHIDKVLLAIELAVKVIKFVVAVLKVIGEIIHFTMLFIGGAVILVAYWGYQCYKHYNGIETTFASVIEAEHGELLQEFAPSPETSPENFIAQEILSRPIDWELEGEAQMAEAPVDLPTTAPTLYQQLPLRTLRKYAKGKVPGFMNMSRNELADAMLACV